METRLMPCPFCGGKARMVVLTSYPPKYQVEHACEVVCAKPADTPEQAIAAWNTRAETRTERDLRDEVNWLNSELHGAEMKRTCRITSAILLYDPDGYETTLSCGHVVHMPPEDFDYCPGCGRKVV